MNQRIKITVLADNKADENLVCEHGFSLLIEVNNDTIVFDTGQKSALAINSERLGINLSKVDSLVLSHGHYDHTGGVCTVLRESPAAKVFLNSAAFLPRYSIRENEPKVIQMPVESREKIINLSDNQIIWTDKATVVNKNVFITGPIPRSTDFEDTGGPFFLDPCGENCDPIDDDQALWIETGQGLIICVGCSHSGIINTLNYICDVSGISKIHTLIGGFHLVNADDERIEKSLKALDDFSIQHIIPCHCTGERAMELMNQKLTGVTLGYAGLEHIVSLGNKNED